MILFICSFFFFFGGDWEGCQQQCMSLKTKKPRFNKYKSNNRNNNNDDNNNNYNLLAKQDK